MDRDCRRCQPLLSAYVDNETNAEENKFIDLHLKQCRTCRETLESYQGIQVQFRKTARPLPPDTLKQAVITQIRNQRGAGTSKRKNWFSNLIYPSNGLNTAIIGVMSLVILILAAALIYTLVTRPVPYGVAEIAADSSEITVRFTQEIDQKAIQEKGQDLFVAKDYQNNNIPYDVKILDSHTVILEPKEPLVPGQSVQVEVKQNIPSKSGDPLPQAYVEKKVVVPAPTPTQAEPTKAPTVIVAVVPTSTPVPTILKTGEASPTSGVTTNSASQGATTEAISTAIPGTTATTLGASPSPDVATPTAVPTPTATPDPCSFRAIRGFGKLYSENPDLATRLGCPTGNEFAITIAYQPFEKGFMAFYNGVIYVFSGKTQGTWQTYNDTFKAGISPVSGSNGTPVANRCSIPTVNGFGKLWQENPSVKSALGCPVAAESSNGFAAYQPFTQGVMLSTPIDQLGKRIYVLFGDGTFKNLADGFSG